MWHADGGMGWWMFWGALMMIVFWGAIIALAVWAVRSLTESQKSDAKSEAAALAVRTPLDIAGERYARGDISREEFEQIRRDLRES